MVKPTRRPPTSPRKPARRQPAPPLKPEPPVRTDLLATTVQAAGELAEIGLAVGSRAVRGMISRLPRP